MGNTKKNTSRIWSLFFSILTLFVISSYFLYDKTSEEIAKHQEVATPIQKVVPKHGYDLFKESISHVINESTPMLLLQVIAILLISRVLSFVFVRLRQPTVIGEILAGILLGPSLLGYFFPEVYHFLFAADTLSNIHILSQVGLVLFMFTIGMELDFAELKNKMGETFVISQVSILFPYFLGMTLAYVLYTEFASTLTSFIPFSLFIGIAMSITAFPVLARIVQEKGLAKTKLGTLAIASAAFDDVAAWCILAVVVAITKTGTMASAFFNITLAVLYVLFMLLIVKPFLKKIGELYKNREVFNKNLFGFIILILISSAFITEMIGIHALFGAFMAGVVMPPMHNFRKVVVDKVEDISLGLLLPLFFVYTGLRTEINLLNTPYLWTVTGLIILVAIVGKFLGSALTAKFLGENWKDSLSLGILMNTRGLMELIVLNIGYEMGVLPPTIFVMFVIMALVTTFMTTPILNLLQRLFPDKVHQEKNKRQQAMGVFKVLIAMGNLENGKNLLNVAKAFLEGSKKSLLVKVLHISTDSSINPVQSEQYSLESFKQINEESFQLKTPIHREHHISNNIELDIVATSKQDNSDFLLVGSGVSLSGVPFFNENSLWTKIKWPEFVKERLLKTRTIFYPGTLIKDKTKYFIEHSECSVGIFVNRNFSEITTTLVMLQDASDVFLLKFARRLLKNRKDTNVFIMDANQIIEKNPSIQREVQELVELNPSVKVLKSTKNNASIISKFSFFLISYDTWNVLSESNSLELTNIPSTLILNIKNNSEK